MKIIKCSILLLSILLTSYTLNAQTGKIVGKVTDGITGEDLIGVSIQIEGTTTGTSTDLDGNYSLENLKPGKYTLIFSYISYNKLDIKDIEVKGGDVVEQLVQLQPATLEIGEVIIESKSVDNTELSLITMQKKSITVQDGISSQEIGRTGASDVASSLKSVTGASIEDGKFVVMRGLGDRYSITQLNGVTLPSTDPYRNSTSLDLIPAGMLDNIVTLKTFTPDQPGNFTGGNVNISTKSFPDKFQLSAGVGISFNTQSSFRSNFLTEKGGSIEWLGYDDGTRSLPEIYKDPNVLENMTTNSYINVRPLSSSAGLRDTFNLTSRGLRNSFVPTEKFVPFDYSANFSIGNQHTIKGNAKVGYFFGLNYSRSYNYYEGGTAAAWLLADTAAPSLQNYFNYGDRRSNESAKVGALGNISFRINTNNEISILGLYNNEGEMTSQIQSGFAPQILSQSANVFTSMVNAYKQRSMANVQLKGRHHIKNARMDIEWVGGYTNSFQKEPDMKLFAYQTDVNNVSYLSSAEFDNPFHYFRDLQDHQMEGKIDFSVQFTKNSANKIQFGGAVSNKMRNFEELRFQIDNNGTGNYINPSNQWYSPNVIPLQFDSTGNFSNYFTAENFGIVDTIYTGAGRYIHSNFLVNQSRLTNRYDGYERIYAGYAMITYDIKRWKFLAGARLEYTDINVTSADTSKPIGDIKSLNVLPAATIIFKINEKMNLRGAFSMTLARPNLREMAPFVAYDLIGGFAYDGNPDLKMTSIINGDLRYEYFFKPGELIAVSTFVKSFTDPIVRSFDPLSGVPTIKFTNVDKAFVFGVELDFRKNLDFIWKGFKNVKFSANFSYIFSQVDINPAELSQILAINPDFGSTRPFQGQSPYLINAALTYNSPKLKFESTLSFNVFGKRLSENSQAGTPDIYELPRPWLNFTASKWFGKKDQYILKLSVQNILNSVFKRIQTYQDQDFVVSEYRIGQTIGLSFTYRIK